MPRLECGWFTGRNFTALAVPVPFDLDDSAVLRREGDRKADGEFPLRDAAFFVEPLEPVEFHLFGRSHVRRPCPLLLRSRREGLRLSSVLSRVCEFLLPCGGILGSREDACRTSSDFQLAHLLPTGCQRPLGVTEPVAQTRQFRFALSVLGLGRGDLGLQIGALLRPRERGVEVLQLAPGLHSPPLGFLFPDLSGGLGIPGLQLAHPLLSLIGAGCDLRDGGFRFRQRRVQLIDPSFRLRLCGDGAVAAVHLCDGGVERRLRLVTNLGRFLPRPPPFFRCRCLLRLPLGVLRRVLGDENLPLRFDDRLLPRAALIQCSTRLLLALLGVGPLFAQISPR